jgi:hypothetical protein
MSTSIPKTVFFTTLALFLSAGCSSTYTVDLTNSTRTTILAQLEIESLGSGQHVLTKAVLSPGEYRQLGPVKAPITDRVRISVTPATGSGGFSERRRLDGGKSFIDVAGDEFGGASITLSIRRDP